MEGGGGSVTPVSTAANTHTPMSSTLMLWYPAVPKWVMPALNYGGGDRERKRWEDNIREWTGLKVAKYQRAVENREKWGKVVAKSSVAPQRPSQLKDR